MATSWASRADFATLASASNLACVAAMASVYLHIGLLLVWWTKLGRKRSGLASLISRYSGALVVRLHLWCLGGTIGCCVHPGLVLSFLGPPTLHRRWLAAPHQDVHYPTLPREHQGGNCWGVKQIVSIGLFIVTSGWTFSYMVAHTEKSVLG